MPCCGAPSRSLSVFFFAVIEFRDPRARGFDSAAQSIQSRPKQSAAIAAVVLKMELDDPLLLNETSIQCSVPLSRAMIFMTLFNSRLYPSLEPHMWILRAIRGITLSIVRAPLP